MKNAKARDREIPSKNAKECENEQKCGLNDSTIPLYGPVK